MVECHFVCRYIITGTNDVSSYLDDSIYANFQRVTTPFLHLGRSWLGVWRLYLVYALVFQRGQESCPVQAKAVGIYKVKGAERASGIHQEL